MLRAYTDYPFVELGDTPKKKAPVRAVVVENYDGDKYCLVRVAGYPRLLEVKSGYLYKTRGRYGSATVAQTTLERLAKAKRKKPRKRRVPQASR